MKISIRSGILATMLIFCFTGIYAQPSTSSTALWLRYPSISPKGDKIAFSYLGDIYVVDSKGGEAKQITTHAAYDFRPVWSPDGNMLAFASDRNGNSDVYVVPAEGGRAVRLTTHSRPEVPYAFTPDGKSVYFGANIQDPAESVLFNSFNELYTVPVSGGRPQQISGMPMEEVIPTPDGTTLYFNDRKGGEDVFRKHQTSAVVRDVWKYDLKDKKYTKLTNTKQDSRNPVLSPDGNTLYFLSERKGSFNVFQMNPKSPAKISAVTHFVKNPVRFLSIARNGLLCYSFEGALYTQTSGGKPQKLDIRVNTDASEKVTELYRSNASEVKVSQDGKQMVLITRGEVFASSVEFGTTKQITHTPGQERQVDISPDGKKIIYSAERDGNWNLYISKLEDEKEPYFALGTIVKEECVYKCAKNAMYPTFSPDGKEVAFLEDRCQLKVLNLQNKEIRTLTDGSNIFSGSDGEFSCNWSPDSKWITLAYCPNKHYPYSDIGIVSSKGDSPIRTVVSGGYFNENPKFLMGGDAILFSSDRYGMRSHASWGSQHDAFVVFLNQAAYDKFKLSKEEAEVLDKSKDEGDEEGKTKEKLDVKKKTKKIKETVIEWDGLEDRIERLTIHSSKLADAVLSRNGEKLYYLAAFEGGYDLWVSELKKKETRLFLKLNAKEAGLAFDEGEKNLFVLAPANPQKITVLGEKKTPINYNTAFVVDYPAERQYLYDHIVKQVREKLFSPDLFGVDWNYYSKFYAQFLPYINNNNDFQELLSELLGELNVSHTGARYRPQASGDETAELGVLLDWTYDGDGLRISEVLENGPLHKAHSKATAGCVIEKINGSTILKGQDYFPLLNRIAGDNTRISVFNPKTNERWDEVTKPITKNTYNDLIYQRWVKRNAQMVDKLSKGRLGYVHLQAMNDESFREIYNDLLGKYNLKDGIVIDTRYNGGGRLHEDIEVLFSGKKYFTQMIRGKEVCDMPSRRWNKPSVMLMSEANYSNAHGTPYVYKFAGIGDLVGMPVPGTMSSVWWENLQDKTLTFGIPIIGMRDNNGNYLENQQLEPDYKVTLTPELVLTGRDEQIEKAVEVLLKKLK